MKHLRYTKGIFPAAALCFLLILTTFTSYAQAGAGKEKKSISYSISPNYRDSLRIDVSFQYSSNEAGKLVLRYENHSWGEENLFNCLTNFKVEPLPKEIRFLPDSSLIVIETLPLQQSRVSYSIKQDFDEPLKNYHRYRPIIQETYFHTLGMRLFITPEEIFGSGADTASVEFIWDTPAAGNIFHSSFGSELHQRQQLTREKLYASFFVGGDFRRYSFDFKGQQIYFVTRGNWVQLSDEALFQLMKKIIPAQMNFWQDVPEAPFSVSLIPTQEEWTETSKSFSIGGSGLTNSFISFASNNPGTELSKISWLYNHEMLHRWLGQTIMNQDEEKQYWFSEGFTEYYAYKLMFKNNEIDLAAYIDIINNEILRPHHKSSINTLPNNEITTEKFWSDRQYHKLPYRRGFLYALLLDLQLKNKYAGKKSLDHLMLDLLKIAKANPSVRFNHDLFQEVLLHYLDTTALNEFDTYIVHGKLIDLQKELPKGLLMQADAALPLLTLEPKAKTRKLAAYLAK